MKQKYREKVVFAVVVKSKHFLADFTQWIKNAIGMNLTAYETMIEDAVEEALYKLYQKYPKVYDIKITTAQVTNGASEIITYGKIKVKLVKKKRRTKEGEMKFKKYFGH